MRWRDELLGDVVAPRVSATVRLANVPVYGVAVKDIDQAIGMLRKGQAVQVEDSGAALVQITSAAALAPIWEGQAVPASGAGSFVERSSLTLTAPQAISAAAPSSPRSTSSGAWWGVAALALVAAFGAKKRRR